MDKNSRGEMDISKLENEMTFRRYFFSRTQAPRILSVPDYIALHIILRKGSEHEADGHKAYLKDLAEEMQLPIRQTSKLAGSLEEKGLVQWLHDGDGSEGTYVTITAAGKNLLEQQQTVNMEYYGKVIDRFGKDNLIQLLNLMERLETVMAGEPDGKEMPDDGYDEIYGGDAETLPEK